MTGISYKAIVPALIVMFMLDIIGGTLMVGAFGVDVSSAAQLDELLQQADYLMLSFVWGTFTTGLGGYLSARWAADRPYLHGAVFGLATLLLAALMGMEGPFWFTLLAVLCTLPAALVGAGIFKRSLG